jgi:hypothetical protein
MELDGSEETIAAMERMGKSVRPTIRKTFREASRMIVHRIRTQRLSGRPGLREGSGRLKKSFRSRVFDVSGGVIFEVYSGSQYVWLQEKGGVVVAKKARGFLAIPTPAYREARGNKIEPKKSFPEFQIAEINNKLVLVRPEAPTVPTHCLIRSVTVPPRLGAEETFKKSMPDVMKLLAINLNKIVPKSRTMDKISFPFGLGRPIGFVSSPLQR